MKTAILIQPFYIKQIGRAAQRLLTPGLRGQVLAVFSNAAYLYSTQGELFWLATEDTPMHRRSLQIPFYLCELETGMDFTVLGNFLRLGDAITIDLANAYSWTSRTFDPQRLLPLGAVSACFREILTEVRCLPGPKGLGGTIEVIVGAAWNGDACAASSSEAALIDQASPAIQELVEACRARDMARIAQSGLRLLGLGPGLTPSGDDYLGGLLFTAHCLKAAYPATFSWGLEPVMNFLHRARSMTNRISYTILSDLAHGHGPEPLHDLVNWVLQGETAQCLLGAVNRLIGIGHTSGWDMLAGALNGMLLTEAKA
ncbi:MAG TPA: hypothetical protein DCP08_09350 [Chloroflexi bacterium]|nr:hypothetical protein [Chloroflexota bacterium]